MKGNVNDLLSTLYAPDVTVVYDVYYEGEEAPTEVVRVYNGEDAGNSKGCFGNMRVFFTDKFTDDKAHDRVSVKKVYTLVIPSPWNKMKYEPSFHFLCEYDYTNRRRSIRGDFHGISISNSREFRDATTTLPRIFTDVGQILNQLLTDLTILQTKKEKVYPLTLTYAYASFTEGDYARHASTTIPVNKIEEDQNVLGTACKYFSEDESNGDLRNETPNFLYLEYQTFNDVVCVRFDCLDGKLPETFKIEYAFADGISEHKDFTLHNSHDDLSFKALRKMIDEIILQELSTPKEEALVEA